MWIYEKTLQFPVNLKNKDLKMAKYYNNSIWWT